MTSKEMLEELLYFSTLDNSGFEPYMKEYAKQIAIDLDVLERIKKYLKYMDMPQSKIIFCQIDSLKDEDFYVIDWWLEKNDN